MHLYTLSFKTSFCHKLFWSNKIKIQKRYFSYKQPDFVFHSKANLMPSSQNSSDFGQLGDGGSLDGFDDDLDWRNEPNQNSSKHKNKKRKNVTNTSNNGNSPRVQPSSKNSAVKSIAEVSQSKQGEEMHWNSVASEGLSKNYIDSKLSVSKRSGKKPGKSSTSLKKNKKKQHQKACYDWTFVL